MPEQRAASDRLLTVRDAATRSGYSPAYMRKLIFSDDRPPFRKVNGQWRIWQSDLDRWVEDRTEA